jgi:hypothetical protein
LLMVVGCSSKSVAPTWQGGPIKSTPSTSSTGSALYWSMWIKCEANWKQKCKGEAAPEVEAKIPDGYVHCRTVGRRMHGPTNTAWSWWILQEGRVRVWATACAGPWWYGSDIQEEWNTYIVPSGQEHEPSNQCVVGGAAGSDPVGVLGLECYPG